MGFFYGVDGDLLERHYRNHLSVYPELLSSGQARYRSFPHTEIAYEAAQETHVKVRLEALDEESTDMHKMKIPQVFTLIQKSPV